MNFSSDFYCYFPILCCCLLLLFWLFVSSLKLEVVSLYRCISFKNTFLRHKCSSHIRLLWNCCSTTIHIMCQCVRVVWVFFPFFRFHFFFCCCCWSNLKTNFYFARLFSLLALLFIYSWMGWLYYDLWWGEK